jgi:hypothetical protein
MPLATYRSRPHNRSTSSFTLGLTVLIRLSITFAGVLTTLALSVLLAAAQSSKPPQPAYPAASPAVQGQPFQDPHGKYRLSIPPGWELSMTGDEPIFRNGTSWIQVRCLTASSASAAVDQAAGLFRSQYTAFNTINRGNTTIGGHARPQHRRHNDWRAARFSPAYSPTRGQKAVSGAYFGNPGGPGSATEHQRHGARQQRSLYRRIEASSTLS